MCTTPLGRGRALLQQRLERRQKFEYFRARVPSSASLLGT